MTSPTRSAANRQNAKKSTGPRTRAGKDRVSHNALRHGLATDLALDPLWTPQIDVIAGAIAGSQAGESTVLDAARMAAAAELELIRVRRIRSNLLADLATLIATIEETESPPMLALVQQGLQAGLSRKELLRLVKERREAQPSSRISALIAELARIERYERRAMSRRKGFFRALDALRPEDS